MMVLAMTGLGDDSGHSGSAGYHAELLAQHGHYATSWRRQMHLGTLEKEKPADHGEYTNGCVVAALPATHR